MRIPRLAPFLLAFAVAPLFADAPSGPSPLTDDEVRSRLTREETAPWNNAVKLREAAEREIKRGKDLQVPPRMRMVGSMEEAPEVRAARGLDIVTKAEARLAEIAKTTDTIRAAATARMLASARRAPCPVVPLADIFKKGATDIAFAAKTAGYERLAVAGVFTSNGETVTADSGFTSAFIAAFKAEGDGAKPEIPLDPAPSFTGGKITGTAPKAAVVIAEMHSVRGLAGLDGMLWTARLTDPATGLVKHVYLAYIPTAQNAYGAPAALEAVFLDRRDFLGKLGAFSEQPFGLDGTGATAALLRATLLAGDGKPPLDDLRFFVAATHAGKSADRLSKAVWSTAVTKEGRILVRSRQAGSPENTAVAVGEILLAPPSPQEVK